MLPEPWEKLKQLERKAALGDNEAHSKIFEARSKLVDCMHTDLSAAFTSYGIGSAYYTAYCFGCDSKAEVGIPLGHEFMGDTIQCMVETIFPDRVALKLYVFDDTFHSPLRAKHRTMATGKWTKDDQ